MAASATEDLLRELAPQVLGVLVRRHRHFSDAEDAVQEALLAAAMSWPSDGLPDNPRGWLITVAERRLIDDLRRGNARADREVRVGVPAAPEPGASTDDSLVLIFMCCHPALTPGAAIPLTLRAVGGLTTREIAAAFLVPEATMAQRITRAKTKIDAAGARFSMPTPDEYAARLASVLHVLYLMFNEGYATSGGPELARTDLSGEAIRLTRTVHAARPDDGEIEGLLALMLLTDARRPARTRADGEIVPLAEQDRRLWNRPQITEGTVLVTAALQRGAVGEYQIQAAIAAVHDQAASHEATEWPKIAALYARLEQLSANPMVTLNRAVAVGMVEGPDAGLALLDELGAQLGEHHRLHAVRAHLLEQRGDRAAAAAEYAAAASGTTNVREQRYLTKKAASLTAN